MTEIDSLVGGKAHVFTIPKGHMEEPGFVFRYFWLRSLQHDSMNAERKHYVLYPRYEKKIYVLAAARTKYPF